MESRERLTEIGTEDRPGYSQQAPRRATVEDELLVDHHVEEVLAELQPAVGLSTAPPGGGESHR